MTTMIVKKLGKCSFCGDTNRAIPVCERCDDRMDGNVSFADDRDSRVIMRKKRRSLCWWAAVYLWAQDRRRDMHMAGDRTMWDRYHAITEYSYSRIEALRKQLEAAK